MIRPWVARAACRDDSVDPMWFFTSDNHGKALGRATCAICPVRRDCLLWSLEDKAPGMYGGVSAKDRKQMWDKKMPLPEWAA